MSAIVFLTPAMPTAVLSERQKIGKSSVVVSRVLDILVPDLVDDAKIVHHGCRFLCTSQHVFANHLSDGFRFDPSCS